MRCLVGTLQIFGGVHRIRLAWLDADGLFEPMITLSQ